MVQHTLIFEIGCEELPASELRNLSEELSKQIQQQLNTARLEYDKIQAYASPQRIAVGVTALSKAQQDYTTEIKGPPVSHAFDEEGHAKPAAIGFAKRCNIAVEDLQIVDTAQGKWLYHKTINKGANTLSLLPDIITNAVAKLSIKKRMRWGDGEQSFSRPVHWILALYGDQTVEFKIFGLTSDRISYGHHFHHPHAIPLSNADDYATELRKTGWVIADYNIRKAYIESSVTKCLKHIHLTESNEVKNAKDIALSAVYDDALLAETAALSEWPVVLHGQFDTRFLSLPKEVLIATMQGHQRYFPVENKDGILLPCFIFVANIASKQPESVVQGNERVLLPRLADAEFFFQQDRKQPLEAYFDNLTTLTFHSRLGTIADKTQRLTKLVSKIFDIYGSTLGWDNEIKPLIERAVYLSRCDLTTQMVVELPELQGIIGHAYARLDGESALVAEAIESFYRPAFAKDDIPTSIVAQIMAVADRLDTLVGIFAIDEAPSGDKDPFALRRAALGIFRILVEAELPLSLTQLINASSNIFETEIKLEISEDCRILIYQFVMERARAYTSDRNIDADIFNAILTLKPDIPLEFLRRADAVKEFMEHENASALASANKRVKNILKSIQSSTEFNLVESNKFTQDEERALHAAISDLDVDFDNALQNNEFQRALELLATLKVPLDKFFDNVMVMDENKMLRNNRLALLTQMRGLFLTIADFSQLAK